jgi:LysM domain
LSTRFRNRVRRSILVIFALAEITLTAAASSSRALPATTSVPRALPATANGRAHPVPALRPHRTARTRLLSAAWYTVRRGDSLSSIAQARCGNARDWTGIWKASRGIANPNLIYPGERLAIDCASVTVQAPVQQLAATHHVQHHVQQPVQTESFGSDPSGDLTRAQVGQLWLTAGGPPWAEYAAEQVSYCESGWNTRAYNPSGASGLWQILGQVVPGYVFDARVNAANAVAKFRTGDGQPGGGDTWAQWVCRP